MKSVHHRLSKFITKIVQRDNSKKFLVLLFSLYFPNPSLALAFWDEEKT